MGNSGSSKSDRRTPSVKIKGIETNLDNYDGIRISNISVSTFFNGNSNIDVWLEIMLTNIGDADVTIEAIFLEFGNPIKKIFEKSSLYEKGIVSNKNPEWSKLYKNFAWKRKSTAQFEYDLNNNGDIKRFCTTPCKFEHKSLEKKKAKFLKINNINDEKITLYTEESTEGSSITLMMMWEEADALMVADENTRCFDLIVETEAPTVKCDMIYAYFILAKGSFFLGSTSKPRVNSFNPHRQREMFMQWDNKYKLKNTRQPRVLRANNLDEPLEDRNYIYLAGTFLNPKTTINKKVKVIFAILISGAISGGLIGSGVSELLESWSAPIHLGLMTISLGLLIFMISFKHIEKLFKIY